MEPRQPVPAFLAALLVLTAPFARADSEIKIQGQSTTTTVWSEIEDDDDANDNDSPRGGNGTQFGNVELGTDNVRQFRIQNKGNETLHVTSLVADSSQYEFTNIELPAVVAAGDDYYFGIRYTPVAFGIRTLRVVMNNDEGPSNSAERRYTFRVQGTGIGPDLRIFGGINQDDRIPDGAGVPAQGDSERRYIGPFPAGPAFSGTHTFTLKNDGNRTLNISNPRFIGPGASVFEHDGVNSGVNIGTGNSRDFQVTFDPAIGGTYDATFLIDTNDIRAGRETYSFALRGFAYGSPILEVEGKDRNVGGFNSIVNGEENPRAGNGTGWGTDNIGDTPNKHQFLLKNVGTGNLTISGFTTTNRVIFPIDDISLPFTIEPDASRSFWVSFIPQQPVDYTAHITVHNDQSSDGAYTFQIGGEGSGFVGAPVEMVVESLVGSPPDWELISNHRLGPIEGSTANGTRFPSTIVGQTRTTHVRIRNAGADVLIVNPFGTLLSDPQFTISGLTLPGGQSRFELAHDEVTEFDIHFTPTSIGFQNGSIQLENEDGNIEGLYVIALSGFGIEEPDAEGPSALVLGGEGFREKVLPDSNRPSEENGTVIGYNRTHQSQFQIFNDGDEALKVLGFDFEGAGELFEITGLANDTQILPGELHEFAIDYIGPNQESPEVTVILQTNQPDLENYIFTIVAIGIDPPAETYPPKITTITSEAADVLLTVDAPPTATFQIYISLDLQTWYPIAGYSNRSAGTHRLQEEINQATQIGQRRYYKVEPD